MATEVSSIPSSAAQLNLAQESSIGVLPGSPVWFSLPVNSYGNFGPTLDLVSRRVISQRRRRKRGDIVAESVAASFEIDFTPTEVTHLMPAAFLSNFTKHPQKGTVFDTGLSVTSTGYDIGADAAAAGWRAGHLVYAEGFATAANNGLKVVTGTSSNEVTVSGLTAEASPPDTAVIRAVGIQFGSGELDVVKGGSAYPILQIASGTLDWTDFAAIEAGTRIYIDKARGSASNRFATAANNGYARVLSKSATDLTLDRVDGGTDSETDMSSETGTGLSVRVFFADKLTDEQLTSAGYNRISHTAERLLGEPNPVANPGDIQTEDILGMVIGTCTISVENQNKATVNFDFIGIQSNEHTGQAGDERLTESVTPLEIETSEFLNNSSHVVRSLLSTYPVASAGNAAPPKLIDFVTSFDISFTHESAGLPAVGRTSAFDVNTNDFLANVALTNYFADIASRKSIRANDRIQFELGWERSFNGRLVGILLDFPSCSLGNGIVEVALDQPMQQPLVLEPADSEEHDCTMAYNVFWFIP